jgi:TolB-like protein/Flp pilus assembly protein TadD
MFTDLVDFTASAQTDEAAALKVLHEQENLVRSALAVHGGREIKSTGDGFLIEFDSALRATECAIAIQLRVNERNSRSEAAPIQLRIGVHLGDVEQLDHDIFGDAVNVASRIGPCAEPGGVCISGPVFDQVRNKIPNPLEKLEATALKNVKFPLDLYRIVLPWAIPKRPTVGSRLPRLAVLPFANISPDLKDGYFADGLTEELITVLSQLPELRVISRTSVMQYRASNKAVSQIGAELGVSLIIEGSVRKAGNRLRITAQLIDVGSEGHLWAKTYDRELDDIFAIQIDVASKVAGSLAQGVLGKEPKRETPDVEAYLSYLRAIQLLHEDTEASLREAVRLFHRAIERDPTFARAYAGLARAWDGLVMVGSEDWEIVSEQAEPAARKALDLATDSAEAHVALAEVHGLLDRFEESIVEAERAIEINPNLSDAYETLGRQQSALGDLHQGLVAFRRAHELDPLAVRTAVLLAWVAQLVGRGGDALEILERMDRLNPSDPRICDGLAEYYRLKGEFSKAREVLDAGLKLNPDDGSLRIDLGVLYAVTGRRGEAERVLRETANLSSDIGRLNATLFIRAALGDLDEAFEALTPLAELHAWPFLIAVLPTFEPLRKDPRYAAFRAQVGLPA